MWIPISTIARIIISYARAKRSAIEWGCLVKSSFDVFLPELAEKLGFTIPQNREEEKLLWRKFSQSIIYLDPENMPDRERIEQIRKAQEEN